MLLPVYGQTNLFLYHNCQFQSLETYTAVTEAFDAAMIMQKQALNKDRSRMSQRTRDYAARLSRTSLTAPKASKEDSEAEVDASKPLGTFVARYLGKITVKEMKGQENVEAAVGAFAAAAVEKKERFIDKDVIAVISGEGIRVIDQHTSQVDFLTRLGTVMFCTSVHAPKVLKKLKPHTKRWEEAIFAYISKDDKLRRLNCELFAVGIDAIEMCNKIQEAFGVALLVRKLRKGNPFAAFSSTREDAPGPLFHLQIRRAALKANKVIGMGQFGEVYLATEQVEAGKGDNGGDTIERAVKMLKGSASTADRGEFLHEAEMMLKLKDPTLVSLVGVAVQQRPWLTVIEFMKYGDLFTFTTAAKEKSFRIRYLEHLHMTHQIAAGMVFIEGQGMIHMDLAARNILLNDNVETKIADFGLTRVIPAGKKYYRLMHTLKLPIKWMALESIVDKIFSPKTDVWAFGITIWEILAYAAIPYGDMKNIDVENSMKKGVRLECAENCPQEFHDLLLKCWLKEPDERPNFTQLREATMALKAEAEKVEPPMRNIGKLLTEWDAAKAVRLIAVFYFFVLVFSRRFRKVLREAKALPCVCLCILCIVVLSAFYKTYAIV